MNSELLNCLSEIANQVSDKIRASTGLGRHTGNIGEGGDQTKVGDQIVEDELRVAIPQALKKNNLPGCLVISEETGQWEVGDIDATKSIFMIIDPIDGSNNLRPHHTPKPVVAFSIGAGLLKDLLGTGTFTAITAGLIRDIYYGDIYTATRGGGSYLNSTIKLQSSPVVDLEASVIGTSLDHTGEKLDRILSVGINELLHQTKCLRRIGSTALDLCRVASGDYDAYLSTTGGLKAHDIAAARLIIEEAGGVMKIFKDGLDVTDKPVLKELFEQGNDGLRNVAFRMIAAGNKEILAKIERIVKF